MSKKYRVGVIGLAHMHVNHLAEVFAQHPLAQLVACADTKPDQPELREGPYTRGWNLKYATSKLGIAKTYDDYVDLLVKEQPDIVICCAENARHAEVVEACAAAKAHVVLEKPMAASLTDALRMVRAAQKAGITLLINWPVIWEPASHKAKQLLDNGVIGRVLQVKWRAGHTGPLGPGVTHCGNATEAASLSTTELAATWWHHQSTGGGAMIDYCCYGCFFARWFIGQPAIAAIGMRANLNSQWSDADDNGAMIARFPNAMGLFEGSWTQLDPGVTPGPIVYGQAGTLLIETRDNQRVVRVEKGHNQTTLHTADHLPQGRHQVSWEMIHHLETGEALHPALEMMFNLEVMAILDAGVRSAQSGQQELVDTPTWRIG